MRATAHRRNARGLRDRQAFERVRMQAGVIAPAAPKPKVARALGSPDKQQPLVCTLACQRAGCAVQCRPTG